MAITTYIPEPELVDHHYIKQRFSLGRYKLYQLLREGKISAKRLLPEGKDRGRTLFVLSSVIMYLDSLPEHDFMLNRC